MSKAFRAFEFEENDHIIKGHVIEADTDDGAFDQAQVLVDGHDGDLGWHAPRGPATQRQTKRVNELVKPTRVAPR
jgi:hypothetical protein